MGSYNAVAVESKRNWTFCELPDLYIIVCNIFHLAPLLDIISWLVSYRVINISLGGLEESIMTLYCFNFCDIHLYNSYIDSFPTFSRIIAKLARTKSAKGQSNRLKFVSKVWKLSSRISFDAQFYCGNVRLVAIGKTIYNLSFL